MIKDTLKHHATGGANAIAGLTVVLLNRYLWSDDPMQGEDMVAVVVGLTALMSFAQRVAVKKGLLVLPFLALLLPAPAEAALETRAVVSTQTATRTVTFDFPEDDVSIDLDELYDKPTVYFDASVSFDFVSINLNSREYTAGVSPGIGYGIKWSPVWWDLTPVFLALDIFVQAGFAELGDDTGPDYFNIDVLPALVIVDFVGIGLGPRFNVALRQELPDRIDPILTFGLRKSL